MIDASSEFRALVSSNHTLLVRARLRLADGTVEELSGSDLMGVSMEEATSSDGSFDIGAAVIGSATVTLQNFGAQWDACDFTGASIALWVGKELTDGTTEWLRRGTWWVDQPDSYGGTIGLSCLDALSRLERPWAEAGVAFPATVGEVAEACCRAGGIALGSADFPGHDALIPATAAVPDGSTCLDVLRWAAQVAGCFARATPEGRVALGWYDLSALEGEDWLDGESFDDGEPSYGSGSDADGGTFDDYSTGDAADGGTFDANRERAHLYSFTRLAVATDDVVVTGVSVTAQDEATDGGTGAKGGTTLEGTEGYVLAVGGNPLVPYGQDAEVAARLAARVVGMRFRPFSGTFSSDPTLEAGDAAVVTDRRQNSHRTVVTRVSLTVNGGMGVACSAKSASRNSAERAGAATSAYVAARKDTDRKLSSRDLAIRDLGQRLDESGGLYHTEETLADGSTVFFMHDKPTVAESRVIWKMTAEAVAVSTDGGKTYATGLSADGTALLNRIYAIGLDASYINTGTLDASKVSIANMMGIGSSEAHILIDGRQIGFFSGQNLMLGISSIPYSVKTFCTFAYDGVLFENTSSTTAAKPVSFSLGVPYEKVFYKNSSGKYANRFGFTIKWRRKPAKYYETFKTNIDESEFEQIPNRTMSRNTPYGEFSIGITRGEDGNAQLTIAPGTGNPVAGEIKAIDFFYSVDSPSANISTPGDKVLTAENLTSVLRDHYDSYCLSLPYAYNNSMMNVLIYIVGGLVAKVEIVTPTSDVFNHIPALYPM